MRLRTKLALRIIHLHLVCNAFIVSAQVDIPHNASEMVQTSDKLTSFFLKHCSIPKASDGYKTAECCRRILLSTKNASTPLEIKPDLCSDITPVPLRDISALLLALLAHLKWPNVILANDYNNHIYQRLAIGAMGKLHIGVAHVFLPATEGDERMNVTEMFGHVLDGFYSAVHSSNILLLSDSPKLVSALLHQAQASNLLSKRYLWLVVCLGKLDLQELALNMTWNSNILMVVPDELNVSDVSEEFQLQNSTTGSEVSLQSNQALQLLTFTAHPLTRFEHLSTWKLGNTWTSPLPEADRLFPNVFRDFGNRLLIIGTIPAKPFVNRQTIDNRTEYTGFCIDLLETMARHLNFRYQIVESPDNKYGAPERDGSWNGMVGMVARNEVDMAVGPYTITSIRKTVVDFSVPFMEDGGGILTKQDTSTTRLMAGLDTFSSEVWLSVLVALLVVGAAFYVVIRFSPANAEGGRTEGGSGGGGGGAAADRGNGRKKSSEDWSPATCILHICGSFMMQGMNRHPKNNSARCVLGVWWVFTILIIATFTASLASVLTVDVKGDSIDSIQDLAGSTVKPLVLSGSIWHTWFLTATESVYKKIADRMQDMPDVTADTVAVDYVLSGEWAFMHDINNVKYQYAIKCKQLYLATTVFNSNGLGVILPERAPFKEAVNDVILRLHEGGFIERWRSVWWPVTTECEQLQSSSLSQAKQLGITKLIGLFIVYGTVVGAAVLCFIASLFLPRCVRWIRERTLRARSGSSQQSDPERSD